MDDSGKLSKEEKFRQLFKELEAYRQAIESAEGALASVEAELDEELYAEYGGSFD